VRELWHQIAHQMMLLLMRKEDAMRTTVTLDDELLKDAAEYTGIQEKSALVNAALKALVEREAARRLARLGGTMPGIRAPRRRRPSIGTPRPRRSKAA
jgi:Arc/MetJ family transcription regulator